jgi:hypothetical protein
VALSASVPAMFRQRSASHGSRLSGPIRNVEAFVLDRRGRLGWHANNPQGVQLRCRHMSRTPQLLSFVRRVG